MSTSPDAPLSESEQAADLLTAWMGSFGAVAFEGGLSKIEDAVGVLLREREALRAVVNRVIHDYRRGNVTTEYMADMLACNPEDVTAQIAALSPESSS